MTIPSKRKDQAIKTYLRIKPTPYGQQPFLTSITPTSVTIRGQEQFTYDRVFDAHSTNRDIFQQIGHPLINHSLQGYNVCVMAYGQTSSGKTYTMKGTEDNQGIIPLALRSLFKTIEENKLLAEIRISYLEIYNENIIDLLNSIETFLELRQDTRKNITIMGLNQVTVSTVEDTMKLFQEGESRRKFASNNLNISSSRSHAIFRINLQAVHEDYSKTSSCINMVDLAGSEGVSRTKAEGNTKKEGENINKSILALSNVIRCMSEKQGYVNFRDSKLTRILQSSLCNNSRSVVICNIYPTAANFQQTMNTLKFGMYASQVKLELKRNVSQTSQKEAKQIYSGMKSASHQDIFQPQERIEYLENKKIIDRLRQENQQLRENKRALSEKIQFLELENHRTSKTVQLLQQKLVIKKNQSEVYNNITNQQRQIYQKKITNLKGQMQIMADKYQALNEYSTKLQKNERHFIQRINRYESQISLLKEALDSKDMQLNTKNKNKAKTPIKPRHFRPNRDRESKEEVCPLTIASIIVLKSQIIELHQDIYRMNQEIAGLVDERSSLMAQIQQLKEKQNFPIPQSQEQYASDVQKKQMKNLNIRIKQLKNQVQLGRNREKKLARLLKQCSKTWIEQFDEFNEWYGDKKKRIDSIKKMRLSTGQPTHKPQKQNQKQKQNDKTQQ